MFPQDERARGEIGRFDREVPVAHRQDDPASLRKHHLRAGHASEIDLAVAVDVDGNLAVRDIHGAASHVERQRHQRATFTDGCVTLNAEGGGET